MATTNELSEKGLGDQALEYTLAANPLVFIRDQEIWDFSGKLFEQIAINPALAAKHYMSYVGELGRIASGDCTLSPDAKDKRIRPGRTAPPTAIWRRATSPSPRR
jgi:hypothetical protein